MSLNQSFFYVALQILNLVVGVFISIYVAIAIEPKTYSIYAIYMIVVGVFAAFSAVGYETVLIRNSLKWQKSKPSKISRFVISALATRVFLSFLIMLIMWIYLYWLSKTNYEGQYLDVFSLFLLIGLFSSLNNSISLILRSFNRYLISFCISILSLLFTKIIAFLAFIEYGFQEFLLVMIISPILVFIASISLVLPYVTKFAINLKYLRHYRSVISFGYMGYLKYLINSSDRLIISALVAPEILASYSLAKQMQNAGKGLIEGFFDPICQKAVQYKGNQNKQLHYLKKLKNIKLIIIAIGVFLGTVCIIFTDDISTVVGLDKYRYFTSFVIGAVCSSLIYLIYKVELNLVSLFEGPKKLLYLDLFSFGIFLSTLLVIVLLNFEELLFLSQVSPQLFLLGAVSYLWVSNKNLYLRYRGL